MINDGLWDVYEDFHMGMTGELVAEKYKIDRAAQDCFALRSQQKAAAAQKAGILAEEIVPDIWSAAWITLEFIS